MLSILQQHKHIDLLLHKGEMVTLRNAQTNLEIACKQGALWITRTGDAKDYVLSQGDHFSSDHTGKVVIEAVDEACVGLEDEAEHELELA